MLVNEAGGEKTARELPHGFGIHFHSGLRNLIPLQLHGCNMDGNDIVNIEEHGQTVNIDVDVPSQHDNYVHLILQDAESDEQVGSIMGNGFPVPEVGEVVNLSEGTISLSDEERIEEGEYEITDMSQPYEIVNRNFVYTDVEIEQEGKEGKEPQMMAYCFVYLDVEDVSEKE